MGENTEVLLFGPKSFFLEKKKTRKQFLYINYLSFFIQKNKQATEEMIRLHAFPSLHPSRHSLRRYIHPFIHSSRESDCDLLFPALGRSPASAVLALLRRRRPLHLLQSLPFPSFSSPFPEQTQPDTVQELWTLLRDSSGGDLVQMPDQELLHTPTPPREEIGILLPSLRSTELCPAIWEILFEPLCPETLSTL